MKGASILVVEDEGIVARDIQYRLETMGYQVPAIASTGEEAILNAWELHPDLVLMDIVLKGDLDGIEATRMIRERADIPVVYLTAYADQETIQRAQLSGPFGYLVKPFEDRELEANIEMALFKHRSGRELRESEQRFRTTVQLASDAILIADSDRRIVMWNLGAEGMFGYSTEEVLGKPLEGLFSEKERETVRESLVRSLSHGISALAARPVEQTARRKEGGDFPVEYSYALWETEGQKFYGIIIRDITERKLAQLALAESEKQYRTLVTSLQEGVGMTDAGDNLLYINPAFCEMLDYRKEELAGKNLSELVHPDERPRIRAETARLKEGKSSRYELRMVRRDGEVRQVQVSTAPWTNEKGEFLGVIGAMMDVTEHRRAERELAEKTDFLEEVINSASDGVFVIDGKGDYVLMNHAAAELIGEPSERWLERHLEDPLHPGDEDSGRAHLDRALAGEPSHFEVRAGPAGREKLLSIALTPMKFSGKPHILGVVSDITERRRAEELLRERAMAELYGFIVSALPVFASSVPPQARDLLVGSFAERFERMIRPRFEQDLAGRTGGGKALKEDSPAMVDFYLGWISNLFSKLGIQVAVRRDGPAGQMEFRNCPWANDASGNPIFCLICRSMAIRSFTWAAPRGHAFQKSSIVGGSKSCLFEFQLGA